MKSAAFKFAMDIESQIESSDPTMFRLRQGRIGTVLEELYPLSRFALALKQPGLDVEIEVYERIGRVDAHIWLTGFVEKDFDVEVTYAGYEYAEALRAELLVQDGVVPGAGPIERNKKTRKVEAKLCAEDCEAPITRLASSIFKQVAAKSLKSYPEDTVLLVAFEDMNLRGRSWWSMLFAKIDELGGLGPNNFWQIYLFNRFTNELHLTV